MKLGPQGPAPKMILSSAPQLDAFELTDVIGNENEAKRQCVGGDQHVVRTDRLSLLFQSGSDFTVGGRCGADKSAKRVAITSFWMC